MIGLFFKTKSDLRESLHSIDCEGGANINDDDNQGPDLMVADLQRYIIQSI